MPAVTASLPFRFAFSVVVVLLIAAGLRLTSRGQINPADSGAVLLDSNLVTESSGLARSRQAEDRLWTHNDSGDSPRLFAVTRQGNFLASLTIQHAQAVDWEDMCSFTRNGTDYLAVADVGDNVEMRKEVVIYGVEEPALPESNRETLALSTRLKFELHVRYPKGPVNCEAIAYDPWRQQFILATKERLWSHIYAVDFDPHKSQQSTTAQLIGSLILPMVTGAAISDDGQLLALSTYGPTCLLRRKPDVDWTAASEAERRQAKWYPKSSEELELVPAPPRRQGEAVCFDTTGSKLLMTSEGSPMPLWTVDLGVPTAP
jgi:hypothetical protein